MTPPPRPPRRRADPERDRRRYLPRGTAKRYARQRSPSLRQRDSNRTVQAVRFFCARTSSPPEGQHPAIAPGPTRSTQSCDDPLPRPGGVRRLRGAAGVASMRSAVRGPRYVGIRADPRNQLVHECRHDHQPRHLNNAHATQLACRHVAMFLQLEVDPDSSLAKTSPIPYKRTTGQRVDGRVGRFARCLVRTVRPGNPASPARSVRACSSRTDRSARRTH